MYNSTKYIVAKLAIPPKKQGPWLLLRGGKKLYKMTQ